MACSAASTSKRQKHSYPDMDRISNLPDSLLCHILSFLPTKKVVATSILSSRWKTLWTLVPKLDFDSRELETKSSDGEQSHNQYHFNFAHIVSRVWALRNANPIQKFRLHWDDNFDHIHVDTWVRAAIARGVKELELEVNTRFGSFPPLYFPCSVFNGNTLVILKLGSFIVLESSPGSSFVFPSLQILHLRITNVDSDSHHDSLSRLHAFCPVLQELFVAIYECRFELGINVPALEYLHFEGNLGDVSLENLPNSVKPVLDLNLIGLDYISKHGNSVWDLLGQLCNVESLHLYSETVGCLRFASEFDRPMFHNLSFLNFGVDDHLNYVLPLLLHRTPNLVVLVFDMERTNSFIDHGYRNFTLDRTFYKDPQDDPKCLSSRLTTCHFKGFEGLKGEMELVRRILKRARVLKTMKISSSGLNSEEQLCVLKELLMFPRHSRTCQIAFS